MTTILFEQIDISKLLNIIKKYINKYIFENLTLDQFREKYTSCYLTRLQFLLNEHLNNTIKLDNFIKKHKFILDNSKYSKHKQIKSLKFKCSAEFKEGIYIYLNYYMEEYKFYQAIYQQYFDINFYNGINVNEYSKNKLSNKLSYNSRLMMSKQVLNYDPYQSARTLFIDPRLINKINHNYAYKNSTLNLIIFNKKHYFNQITEEIYNGIIFMYLYFMQICRENVKKYSNIIPSSNKCINFYNNHFSYACNEMVKLFRMPLAYYDNGLPYFPTMDKINSIRVKLPPNIYAVQLIKNKIIKIYKKEKIIKFIYVLYYLLGRNNKTNHIINNILYHIN